MILFPYKKVVIETEMNHKLILEKLKENTIEWSPSIGKSKYLFAGTINLDAKKFLLHLIKEKRDQSIRIEGNFITQNKIKVIVKWSFIGYLIFCYLCFFSFVAMLLFLSVLISKDRSFITMLISIFFFSIPYLFIKYHNFKDKSEKIILKILQISEGKLCKE